MCRSNYYIALSHKKVASHKKVVSSVYRATYCIVLILWKYDTKVEQFTLCKSIKDAFLLAFGTEFAVRKKLVFELASAKQLNTLLTKIQKFADQYDIPITYGPSTSPIPIGELPHAVAPDRPLLIQLTKLRHFDDIDNNNDDFEPIAILLTDATYFLKNLPPGYIDRADLNTPIPDGPPDHV